MTATDLRLRLIRQSPFLLQKTVEESDRFVFLDDTLLVNDHCIGRYRIIDHTPGFTVHVDSARPQEGRYIEVQVDGTDKQVLLRLSDLYTAYQLTGWRESLSLLPMKRVVDDEKSEL